MQPYVKAVSKVRIHPQRRAYGLTKFIASKGNAVPMFALSRPNLTSKGDEDVH